MSSKWCVFKHLSLLQFLSSCRVKRSLRKGWLHQRVADGVLLQRPEHPNKAQIQGQILLVRAAGTPEGKGIDLGAMWL